MLNIADMRTRHSREAFDSLREHFGEKLLDTTIRASIAYAESAERAVSILDYRPDLAADYLAVADELLQRLGLDGAAPARPSAGQRCRRRFVGGTRARGVARRHTRPLVGAEGAGRERQAQHAAAPARNPAREAISPQSGLAEVAARGRRPPPS